MKKIGTENAINNESNKKVYTVFKNTEREFTGNLNEIAKHFNLDCKLLNNRVNLTNFNIEEAIDFKPVGKCFIVFKDTSKEFKGTLSEISNHFNIPFKDLNQYINDNKSSIGDAIDFFLNARNENLDN